MKIGIASVRVMEIQCPNCGEFHANAANGSHSWTEENANEISEGKAECFFCHTPFRFPAVFRRFAGLQ